MLSARGAAPGRAGQGQVGRGRVSAPLSPVEEEGVRTQGEDGDPFPMHPAASAFLALDEPLCSSTTDALSPGLLGFPGVREAWGHQAAVGFQPAVGSSSLQAPCLCALSLPAL